MLKRLLLRARDDTKRSLYGTAALCAAFAASVFLVNPAGNFPLNDDWNFALATWWFSEHGVFRFARATAMSLRAQVVWGALWTWLFGESFEVLRAATLFVSLGTVLLLQRLLRRCGVPAAARTIVALTLLFHPIFLWSSFTYMTEVPFVCASLLAFYCFARGSIDRSVTLIALGGAAVLISCWIRQTGIVNALPPIALIVITREQWSHRWRIALAVALAPVLLFGVLFAVTDWFVGYPEEIAMHYDAWRGGGKLLQVVEFAGERVSENMLYGGLFFLPLLLPMSVWLGRNRKRWLLWMFCFAAVVPVASARIALREPMPFRTFGNVFVNLGLGPLTLRDTWVFGYTYPRHLEFGFRIALTLVAAAFGALLLALLVSTMLRMKGAASSSDQIAGMAAIHGLASTLVLAASPFYFDRYSLDSLWGFAVIAAVTLPWPAWRLVTTAVATAVFALLSIAFTAEYLSWNRARWSGLEWLRGQGVRLDRIDGGYEINQYLIGGFDGKAAIGKFQFSVIDDEYIIAFNEVRGYRTINRVRYSRAFSADGELLIQQRTTGFVPTFALDDGD